MPRRRQTNRPTNTNQEDNMTQVNDTNPTEEQEIEEQDQQQGMRPKDLAEELDISPKSLRAFLRREFPRASEEKNTNWLLSDEMVDKAREHFEPEDDDEETDETPEDES